MSLSFTEWVGVYLVVCVWQLVTAQVFLTCTTLHSQGCLLLQPECKLHWELKLSSLIWIIIYIRSLYYRYMVLQRVYLFVPCLWSPSSSLGKSIILFAQSSTLFRLISMQIKEMCKKSSWCIMLGMLIDAKLCPECFLSTHYVWI